MCVYIFIYNYISVTVDYSCSLSMFVIVGKKSELLKLQNNQQCRTKYVMMPLVYYIITNIFCSDTHWFTTTLSWCHNICWTKYVFSFDKILCKLFYAIYDDTWYSFLLILLDWLDTSSIYWTIMFFCTTGGFGGSKAAVNRVEGKLCLVLALFFSFQFLLSGLMNSQENKGKIHQQ